MRWRSILACSVGYCSIGCATPPTKYGLRTDLVQASQGEVRPEAVARLDPAGGGLGAEVGLGGGVSLASHASSARGYHHDVEVRWIPEKDDPEAARWGVLGGGGVTVTDEAAFAGVHVAIAGSAAARGRYRLYGGPGLVYSQPVAGSTVSLPTYWASLPGGLGIRFGEAWDRGVVMGIEPTIYLGTTSAGGGVQSLGSLQAWVQLRGLRPFAN